ncbi:hypothetical protein RJT34_07868 [Clitoria ternatea]|uniref:Calmodulin-binding protein n=1 Tax=Clitoria ternatea TaxID=43366 RepID=A0AAN9K333_CLITE
MEVVVAVPPPAPPPLCSMEFNFDSNCSSPYITAPSSPQRFGNFFFSAPTSPTRGPNSSLFNHHLNETNNNPRYSSVLDHNNDPNEDDFQFDFGAHLEKPSLSADELFDGGKIRPLNSSSSKATSPSRREKEKRVVAEEATEEELAQQHKRASSFFIPSTTQKTSRKTSTGESNDVSPQRCNTKISESSSSFLSSISFPRGYRKWRIKDFLLFRSASEGRASDKDPLRRYTVLSKTAHEDVRNLSFRSTESSGSVSRRRGPVSAHELHYTVNRAASEELKKKTLLPYKQGLLGCLGFNFNPGMHHISRRIGSMERS